MDVDRSTVRYRSRRPDDAPIRARLRELAAIAGALAIDVSTSCYAEKVRA